MKHFRILSVLAFAVLALSVSANAEDKPAKYSFNLQGVFYGDNTEFIGNPFREGETTLGNYEKAYFSIRFGDKARLNAGVFGNQQYGYSREFTRVAPVISLTLGTERNRFVFGTLETGPKDRIGPDLATPHGLAPALQMETLTFQRPLESGLQWLLDGKRVQQDWWINWQQLNTPVHREKFDTGIVSRIKMSWPVDLGFQAHIVHYGGQLYSSGVVSDSIAYGPGVIFKPRLYRSLSWSGEAYYLRGKDVPDRGQQNETVTGSGLFLRLAAEKNDYRWHSIVWRGSHFIKREGDPNYGSLREDGVLFGGVRDYLETGLAKMFQPAKEVHVEVSGRWYWIEHDMDYSYRVLAILDLHLPIRTSSSKP